MTKTKQLSLENSQISIFFTTHSYDSNNGLLRLWYGDEIIAVLNGNIYLHHSVGDYAEVYHFKQEDLIK